MTAQPQTQTLRPYQERIVGELRALSSSTNTTIPTTHGVVIPYGGGKTWTVVEAARQHALAQGRSLGMIFLCKSRAVNTITTELEKRLPAYFRSGRYPYSPIVVMKGNHAQRYGALCEAAAKSDRGWPWILVIPYPSLRLDHALLCDLVERGKLDPGFCVADESTTIKNPKSQVSKAAHRLARALHDSCTQGTYRCVILTGNMMPEGWHEIWSQLAFALPPARLAQYGPTYYAFMRKFFLKTDRGWALPESNHARLDKLLTEDISWLFTEELTTIRTSAGYPLAFATQEHYSLHPLQIRALDQLMEEWTLYVRQGDGATAPALEEYNFIIQLVSKAQQICSGFTYTSASEVNLIVPCEDDPKLKLFVTLIQDLLQENPQRKFVVWVAYRWEHVLIKSALDKLNIPSISGADTAAAPQIFADVPDLRVITMPIQCGQSLNELAVADTGIFYSQTPSVEQRQQAEARINRPNNPNLSIRHIDLIADNSREATILAIMEAKRWTPADVLATLKEKEKAKE